MKSAFACRQTHPAIDALTTLEGMTPGQLEKFMSENIGQKIIGAIDRAITGTKPTPKKSPVENAASFIVELALPKIQKLAGFTKWLADEKQIRHLADDGNKLGEYCADAKYFEQQREHEAMLAEGKSLSEIPRGRSREGWQSDFAARKSANDSAICKINGSLAPFRKQIAAALVEQLNASCAELMLAESRLGAKFGIIYSESATLKTMRGIQNYITAAGPGIVFNLSTK